jgi:phosphoglycolate phosphatase-like HAD superfamily hydrolase
LPGDGEADARGAARAGDDCRLALKGKIHPVAKLRFNPADAQIFDLEKLLDTVFRTFTPET